MRYPQRRGKDEIEGNLKKLAQAHLSLYVYCFVVLLLKSLFTYQMKQKRHVNFIFLQGKEGEIDNNIFIATKFQQRISHRYTCAEFYTSHTLSTKPRTLSTKDCCHCNSSVTLPFCFS